MAKAPLLPIFDGHNDLLLRLWKEKSRRSFFVRGRKGHIDLPRARKGNLAGGFFAIFAPSRCILKTRSIRKFAGLSQIQAKKMTDAMIDHLVHLEIESQGAARMVRTVDDLTECLKNNVLAMILHFEGAEAIRSSLEELESFYEKGLRSIGPVWSRSNAFAHGVPFAFPHSPDTGPGLTKAGIRLVKKCNEMGILIDLSHLNEKGFWDIAKYSNAPLVATHSNAHALTPSSRNLTDKQLDAIKDSDGMVGVNFAVQFLRSDGKDITNSPLHDIVRHLDYLVEKLGINRVGFGSDFDGAKIPDSLGDASGLPRLITALRRRGYTETDLHKLTHQNWIRVLRLTWSP